MFLASICLAAVGCGTTKWSDTPRTATEQLLISTAVDRAIDGMNFKPLAGKDVYLDTTFMEGIIDKNYVISSLRQHMLAQGCVLAPSKDQATYVVEARAGAVGTNHHDVMVGVPALSLPGAALMPGVPSAIPEIAFAKTTDQKGVAKIAAFAYNQKTGQPVWQSGVFPIVTDAKDTWIFGTGPFQRGTIYDRTHFAGSRLLFGKRSRGTPAQKHEIPLTAEAVFDERPELAKREFPIGAAKANPPAAGSPPSATPPGAPGTNATAGSANGLGGIASLPSQPSSTAPNATSGSQDGLPAGRVVRLPPLEQVARPDLQQKLESKNTSSAGGSSNSFDLFKLR
ncbi:MAG TPA: DUF6655 family protein [Pirellulales bacterium]|nr:DUF6655 family protein [Pirellulales bacterium]